MSGKTASGKAASGLTKELGAVGAIELNGGTGHLACALQGAQREHSVEHKSISYNVNS